MLTIYIYIFIYLFIVLGTLGVTCPPRDLWFAVWNPATIDEIFPGVAVLSTKPPGENLSIGF